MNSEKLWNPRRRMSPAILILLGVAIGLVFHIVQIERMRAQVRAMRQEVEKTSAETEQLRKTLHESAAYYRSELSTYEQLANVRPAKPNETDKSIGMTCSQEFGPEYGAGSGVRSWRPRADGRCYSADAR